MQIWYHIAIEYVVNLVISNRWKYYYVSNETIQTVSTIETDLDMFYLILTISMAPIDT